MRIRLTVTLFNDSGCGVLDYDTLALPRVGESLYSQGDEYLVTKVGHDLDDRSILVDAERVERSAKL